MRLLLSSSSSDNERLLIKLSGMRKLRKHDSWGRTSRAQDGYVITRNCVRLLHICVANRLANYEKTDSSYISKIFKKKKLQMKMHLFGPEKPVSIVVISGTCSPSCNSNLIHETQNCGRCPTISPRNWLTNAVIEFAQLSRVFHCRISVQRWYSNTQTFEFVSGSRDFSTERSCNRLNYHRTWQCVSTMHGP